MSCIDWKAIKAEYIAGGTSYRKLAEKHGVSFTTLTRVAKRERWVDLRQQADDKATTKIVEQVSNDQASKAISIIGVADKLLDKIAEYVDTLPIETMAFSQSIKHITSALKDIKDIKNCKSDADIREQEARIKKLEREAERDVNKNAAITITLEGDLNEYAQ